MLVTPYFLDPSRLSSVELQLIHESCQALVISVDRGFSSFEVAAPFTKRFHECVELMFPSGVAGDGMGVFSRKKTDGMRVVGRSCPLKENSAHSKVGGVRVDFEGKRKVGQSEAWSGGDEGFEVIKSLGARVVPVFADVVILVSREVSEWCRMRGEMIDEATVVAGETEEGADVSDGSGRGPIFDCRDFGGIHDNGVPRDDVAEELDGEFSERALVKTSEVVVLAENAEDYVEVFGVLSGVLGEDEDVVEEDNNEVVEVGSEDVIHGALKRSRGVGETKGHDFELIVTVASTKSCLGNIFFSHTDLPVA